MKKNPAIPEHTSNVANASAFVSRELQYMALEVDENSREEYFDPRNRDNWMDEFVERLKTKYQKPERIASNE